MMKDMRILLRSSLRQNEPAIVEILNDLRACLFNTTLWTKSDSIQENFVIGQILWRAIFDFDWPRASFFPNHSYLDIGDWPGFCSPKSDNSLSLVDLAIIDGFINAYFCSSKIVDKDCGIFCQLLEKILLKKPVTSQPTDNFWRLKTISNCLQKCIRFKSDFTTKLGDQSLDFIRKQSLLLVHSYWDNKFAGVSELSVEIFRDFFQAFCLNLPGNEVDRLVVRYLDDFPFFVRGKYRIIAKLIEFAGVTEFLNVEQRLCEYLTLPCSSNHIGPFVGTVYKAALRYISEHASAVDEIVVDRWLRLTFRHLCSTNEQLRRNTSKQFLPAAAKYLSAYYEKFLVSLARHSRCSCNKKKSSSKTDFQLDHLLSIDIRSLTSIDMLSNGQNLLVVNEFSRKRDDDESGDCERLEWTYASILRQATSVKNFAFTKADSEFLRRALRARCDETRLQAFTCLADPLHHDRAYHMFLTYDECKEFLRSNCLVADPAFRKAVLKAFNKWLTCYLQRAHKTKAHENAKQIAIDFIIDCTQNCFMNLFPCANYQRLNLNLGLLDNIWRIAEEFTLLDVVGPKFEQNCPRLIRYMQNSSGDVRECCRRLLNAVDKRQPINNEYWSCLIKIAENLSESPKALDCESGVTIWTIIFDRYCFERKLPLVTEVGLSFSGSNDSVDKFCQFLAAYFAKVKQNLLLAASESPLHGFISAFATYLKIFNRASCCLAKSDAWKVFNLCRDISDYFFRIFGSDGEGECPSLAQMDLGIQDCINEQSIELTDTNFSNDGQLLLACCWLNVQECAYLLAELFSSRLVADDDSKFDLFSTMGDNFFEMMTRTRHWGVLESCSDAFGKFCKVCGESSSIDIKNIPERILDKIFRHVERPQSVSITRRAVGFPMMIHCIAANTSQDKLEIVLKKIFDSLLSIADRSLNYANVDDLSDLALVRAMHCLRHVVRCSQLGLDVLQYLYPCFKIVLRHICSPMWPVRNASVLLLSALFWRLFGRLGVQMAGADYDSLIGGSVAASVDDNAWTLSEFRASFDDFWQLCSSVVTKRAQFIRRNDLVEDSTDLKLFNNLKLEEWKGQKEKDNDFILFAVFSILKNIRLTKFDEEYIRWKNMDDCVLEEFRQNMLCLTLHLSDYRLRRICAQILSNFTPDDSQRVLFARSLVAICKKELTSFGPEKNFDSIPSSYSSNYFNCPASAGKFSDLLAYCQSNHSSSMNKIDGSLRLAEFFLSANSSKGLSIDDSSFLLCQYVNDFDSYFGNFRDSLSETQTNGGVSRVLHFYVSLYRNMKRSYSIIMSCNSVQFWDFVMDCCDRKFGLSAQCSALPLFTLYVTNGGIGNKLLQDKWLRMIEVAVKDQRSENVRLSAAHSLILSVPFWPEFDEQIFAKLFFAAISLLLDEDGEVRYAMSAIIDADHCLNPFLCLEALLDKVTGELTSILNFIFNQTVVTPADFKKSNRAPSRKTYLFSQTDFNIYREDFLVLSLFSNILSKYCQKMLDLEHSNFKSMDALKANLEQCALNFLAIVEEGGADYSLCSELWSSIFLPAYKTFIWIKACDKSTNGEFLMKSESCARFLRSFENLLSIDLFVY